jgi:TPP-dependent 2-oxoacid decarboxylase
LVIAVILLVINLQVTNVGRQGTFEQERSNALERIVENIQDTLQKRKNPCIVSQTCVEKYVFSFRIALGGLNLYARSNKMKLKL